MKRIIRELNRKSRGDPDKRREYEYVKLLFRDIVNTRIRKIVNLAISSASSRGAALRNMQPEKRSCITN